MPIMKGVKNSPITIRTTAPTFESLVLGGFLNQVVLPHL